MQSTIESLMLQQIKAVGLAEGLAMEWRFDPTRRWRFDFAWPEKDFALEVEGGTWSCGRHTRGGGFERDAEKYATALLMGWRVLHVTGRHVRNGVALGWVEQALGKNHTDLRDT
jgi:hypothetical protein